MLITVFSTLIFMKKSTESFPKRISNFWNGWEIRGLVLLSLLLQIVLILLGKWRKYIPKNWIKIILWGAYLSADWIATLSLGILSRKEISGKNQSFDHNYVLMAFWAPFLLVHLGGPDTITSYSLEDNELWPRRLLELLVQLGVAIYVLVRSWVRTLVNFLAFPMFIAGIIKFGERIWVLRSASSDVFRDSLLPLPDPGPNYAKFMDGYSSKKAEGFKIKVRTIIDTSTVVRRNNSPSSDALRDAYYFFKNFKRLFADLILSFQDRENSRSFFLHTEMTCKKAFEVIEIELGFMYDLLHTKASFITSRLGSFCRVVSLLCTFSAFIGFLIIDKNAYSTIDKSITLLLLVGAIVLEIYAVIVLLPSDWTTLWLSKHENKLVDLISKANSCFQSCFGFCFLLPLNKRWSNSVAQYNLMSHCIKRKSFKGSRTKNFIKHFSKDFIKDFIHKMLEKYWYRNLKPVSKELKEKIFDQLKNAESITDIRDSYMQLFACTGDDHDEEKKRICNLDETILRLHIATDLCYYIDRDKDRDNDSETEKNQNV